MSGGEARAVAPLDQVARVALGALAGRGIAFRAPRRVGPLRWRFSLVCDGPRDGGTCGRRLFAPQRDDSFALRHACSLPTQPDPH